jgi:hypothetical protein
MPVVSIRPATVWARDVHAELLEDDVAFSVIAN